MTIKSVVDFFAVVQADKALQQKIKMAADLDTVIKIAEECDYKFTGAELQSFLGKVPNQDLASEVNPGIGNRLHLSPR
jgi:predicted ribosomally synthesized peptide with nif11-like leader